MRILVVEDDKGVARFIKKGLEEQGFTADVAFDGDEGIYLGTTESYALIILDIMLPETNGFEVLKTIRKRGLGTPVIILTAKSEKANIIHGLEIGADDYLVKPFAFAELLARIKAILRRGQKEQHLSRICVADLTLDLIGRTACRNEKTIELSGKEFKLLLYMLKNTGQVLTRTMILEQVWGYDFDPGSNVIDVHVNRLRTKVDKGFSAKLIHTIKGVGYVLKAEE